MDGTGADMARAREESQWKANAVAMLHTCCRTGSGGEETKGGIADGRQSVDEGSDHELDQDIEEGTGHEDLDRAAVHTDHTVVVEGLEDIEVAADVAIADMLDEVAAWEVHWGDHIGLGCSHTAVGDPVAGGDHSEL